MGFLDNDSKPSMTIDGNAAYLMVATGDLPGAWMLLSQSDSSSAMDLVYNKALCLRAAGRPEEALELSRLAFRRLTEGVPQKPFDPVGTVLISSMSSPGPMNPSMPKVSPTYAGLQARWLYCLCLMDCGDREECARVAAPLAQMNIGPAAMGGK